MNYAVGHAFNTNDIFYKLDKKKLSSITSKLSQEITGDAHKDTLIGKIFKESIKVVLNDIIENNVTFQLPLGKSDIHVLRVDGEDFKKARRKGKWKDVDFLASFFSGYQLVLNMYNKDGGVTRTKLIYVDKELKNKLTQNTNNGKQYC